jgi:hypothetical protein
MNLTESLSFIKSRLDYIYKRDIILTEAKGHLDHPEDLIFIEGTAGAQRAIQTILNTVKSPESITVKFDGYPALIFGRGNNGKFSIMDKHMFNKKDMSGRQIYSPEEFIQYDQARGVDRQELHQLITNIWNGLAKSDSGKGYYWGDVLFRQPLKPASDGLYHFRANPNGITYTVDPNSDIGKDFTGKTAGIVVHQFIPANASSTDDAVPLNGTLGNLKNNSNVAIVPAKMPITPKLKIDSALVNNAKKTVEMYGSAVDNLLTTAPQASSTFQNLFTTYINKRIVSKNIKNLYNGFMEYVQARPMSDSMRQKLTQHLQDNKEGLKGIFLIWIELYKLKMALVEQLNKASETAPVQGYLQDGTRTQEGFVSQGLKFVDRMGFSAQNLAGR